MATIKPPVPLLRLPGLSVGDNSPDTTTETGEARAFKFVFTDCQTKGKHSHPLSLSIRSKEQQSEKMTAAGPATLMLPGDRRQPALTPPPSSLTLSLPQSPQIKRSISAPGLKVRQRASLGPGCSMMDWIRLCKNTPDMAGNGGTPRPVSREELARHCTEDDAWTCYNGKVYNITAYFRFHPGGKEDLMKAAGKDCTILFDEAHKWVNIQSMLKRCYVGDLADTCPFHTNDLTNDELSARRGSFRSRSGSRTLSNLKLGVPETKIIINGMNRQAVAKRESESSEDALVHTPQSPVNPPIHVVEETDSSTAVIVIPPSPIRKNSDASRPTVPRYDWYQTEKNLMIHIFTHNKNLKESDIVADLNGQVLEAEILIDNWIYQLKINLLHSVSELQVSIHSTKVEIRLTKVTDIRWESVGTSMPGNDQMVASSNRVKTYRPCTVKSIETVTHDTKVFTLSVPPSSHLSVPVGHHVSLRAGEKGHEIERDYTPIKSFGSPSSSSSIKLMIKLYSDGAMSQYLSKLKKGDALTVSNPSGTFDANRLQSIKDSILIAAGSGVTPMFGLLHDLLNRPSSSSGDKEEQPSKHHLIFANKTEKDIIWRKELDKLAKDNKNFKVTHILSSPDKSWNGYKGRVTPEFLQSHLPAPSFLDKQQRLICVCGPQPFTTSVLSALLEMDYPESCIHVFD
ncbi:PREDICTED: cytochrome b5 reductase 4-like [Amphimedon queenslandica]|uniref:Cytochrome b5 reductase 4 n=1 Tax=Amphimedon queenslandica TaxID=400682 RepID=A0A1X7UG22_AMPQE|nr:PREDICTED: cytochrome b5 reductase 4-like [Amphimedon queenslandica]|eukprot:XP_019854312.1 PREDICTED: cytochrome b5 reductase 4-like [Amphimedon queenslandica]